MEPRSCRRHTAAAVFGAALAWTCATGNSAAQPSAAPGVGLQLIASGLSSPVALANAGDGSGRLFIVEQAGVIKIYDGAQVRPTPFLDIGSKILSGGERGLLGLAFDPSYRTNGFFYVFYTSQPAGTITIARYSVSPDPNIANPNSELVLKTQAHAEFANHNGGALVFGPDGCLYAGIGDGGDANDPHNNGQNLGTLLGKIIRISAADGTPCSAAPGNPFVATTGARGEIWALGLRNPWRITFDRATGDLLIADVGQSQREEVNFQPAGSAGRNYCWKRKEGTLIFDASIPCTAGTPTDPVLEYGHTDGNCSITGGYRYRGSPEPGFAGTYFYGDFCSGRIWGASERGGVWTTTELLDTGLNISTFGEDERGELYVAGLSGVIYHLVVRPCEAVARFPDFNGDARADIPWRYTSGAVGEWLLNGASLTSATIVGSGASAWRLIGEADFNGDGKSDFLWRHSSGAAGIWLMDGTRLVTAANVGSGPLEWHIVGAGDLNGDGKADIIWRHDSGAVGVWFMNGISLIAASSFASAANEWHLIAIGDFNGDGKSDFLWRHDSGAIGIWLMNGTAIISAVSIASVSSDWRVVAIGDLNGDGKSDLVWRHKSGTVGAWLLNGSSILSLATVATAGPDWHIAGSGDTNGDGKSDILWRDNSGNVAVWFMNGTAQTGAASIGSGAAEWHIVGGEHDPPLAPGQCGG